MDIEGFRKVNDALAEAEIAAVVAPEPQPEEDVEYVTITTENEVPAAVLNALGKAGLTAQTAGQRAADGERFGYARDAGGMRRIRGPKLEPLFGQPGSVTFVDTNNGA